VTSCESPSDCPDSEPCERSAVTSIFGANWVASSSHARFHASGNHASDAPSRRESPGYFHAASTSGTPSVTSPLSSHSHIVLVCTSSWATRASVKLLHSANGTTSTEVNTIATHSAVTSVATAPEPA
jgi:hypothetical protein